MSVYILSTFLPSFRVSIRGRSQMSRLTTGIIKQIKASLTTPTEFFPLDPSALRLGHLRFVFQRRREGRWEEVVMDPEGENVGAQGVREKSEIVVSLTTTAAKRKKKKEKEESAVASAPEAEEGNGEKEKEKEAGGKGVVIAKKPSRMKL